MSSFNAYVHGTISGGDSIPVWLGVVSPRPVGGKLATGYAKAGAFFNAGTPVNLKDGVLTPFVCWEVVEVDTTNHVLTVKASHAGILPAKDDFLGIVGATFAATGAAGKVSSVAAGATDGQYDITLTDAKLDGATAGQFIAFSAADAVAASGKSLAVIPNGYLYNDIRISPAPANGSYDEVSATGAVVDFHGEGLRVKLTGFNALAAQLKAAIPNVVLVEY